MGLAYSRISSNFSGFSAQKTSSTLPVYATRPVFTVHTFILIIGHFYIIVNLDPSCGISNFIPFFGYSDRFLIYFFNFFRELCQNLLDQLADGIVPAVPIYGRRSIFSQVILLATLGSI